jgi:mutator protein MutT
MKSLSSIFEPYLKIIREALKNKKQQPPSSEEDLEQDQRAIKKAFDNNLIDLDEYITQLTVVKAQLNELKKKKQSYADAIIVNDKGEILFLRRSIQDDFCPDCWSLPGGKIEKGEKPEEAVIREVKEETDLEIISTTLLLEKEIEGGKIYYFQCQAKNQLLEPSIILDSSEHIGYCFASEEKWSEMNLIMDLKNTLKDIDEDIVTFSPFLPLYGPNGGIYSNIIEAIADIGFQNTKDAFMYELFDKNELDEEQYLTYIFKAHSDSSKGEKNMKVIKEGEDGKKVIKWVTKEDLRKLAHHAKHSSETDLQKTIKEHRSPIVRKTAHKELNRRQKHEAVVEK